MKSKFLRSHDTHSLLVVLGNWETIGQSECRDPVNLRTKPGLILVALEWYLDVGQAVSDK